MKSALAWVPPAAFVVVCAVSLALECAARTLAPGTCAQEAPTPPPTAPERLLHARLEFPTIGGGKPSGLLAADLDGDQRSELVVVTSAPSTLQVWSGLSRVMLGWPDPRALPIDDFCLGPLWVGGSPPTSKDATADIVIASRASSVIQVIDARGAWRSPEDAPLDPFVRWSVKLAERPRVLATGRDAAGRAVIAAITIGDELVIAHGPEDVAVTKLDGVQATCAAFDGEGRSLYVGFQASRTLARYTLESTGKVGRASACPLPGLPRSILVLPPRQQGIPALLVAGGDGSVWACGGENGPHVIATYDGGTIPIALVAGTILGAEKFVSIALQGQEAVVWDTSMAAPEPIVPVRTYAGQHPRAAAIGDFDGDGLADLGVANGDAQRVSILFTNPNGTFDVSGTSSLGRQVQSLAAGDLDGDGKRDIVSQSGLENTLSVSRFTDGRLADHRIACRVDHGDALRLADLDRDGALDALFLRGEEGTVLDAAFGDGQGNLFRRAAVEPRAVAASQGDVLVTDLDGDGRLEAAVSDPAGGRVALVDLVPVKDAGVEFGAPRAIAVPSGPRKLALVDVEGDAKPEIAVGLAGPGNRLGVAFLRARPDASGALVLEEIADLKLSAPVSGLAVADCDSNGTHDLVVLVSKSDSDNHLEVWFQSKQRAWTKNDLDLPTGLRPYALRMADLDGDGIADIVCSAQNSHHLNVWLNAGGTPLRFARIADVGVGTGPLDVQLADLDGDGVVEIVTANGFSNDLSLVRLK